MARRLLACRGWLVQLETGCALAGSKRPGGSGFFSIRSQKPFMGNGPILDDFLGYRHFRKFHENPTRIATLFWLG